MQAVLVMFRSDGERRSFSITRSLTIIGRREDCDLRIPLGDVSRKHCRVIKEGDQVRLEDMGSSNGTFHNGHRVEKEALIQAGDSIQVGPVVFVLQVDGYPADDELSPITTALATPGGGGDGQDPEMEFGAGEAAYGGEPQAGVEAQGIEAGELQPDALHEGAVDDGLAPMELLEPLDEAGIEGEGQSPMEGDVDAAASLEAPIALDDPHAEPLELEQPPAPPAPSAAPPPLPARRAAAAPPPIPAKPAAPPPTIPLVAQSSEADESNGGFDPELLDLVDETHDPNAVDLHAVDLQAFDPDAPIDLDQIDLDPAPGEQPRQE